MLDLVVDVKNNRTRDVKKGGGAVVPSLVPAVTKWMKGTGVEDLAVGGIRWQKVMDPSARYNFFSFYTIFYNSDNNNTHFLSFLNNNK